MSCSNFRLEPKNCGCFASSKELIINENMSEDERYNAIIAHYKATYSESDKHLLDVKNAATIEIAIKLAATARDAKGYKHGHQNLISPYTLEQFSDKVHMRKDEIASATSFKQLHSIVKACRIKGIGELCIYDTAHRLGGYLNLPPDSIYLHRGTKQGAIKLIGKVKGACVSKDMLPAAFQREDLSNPELEDILCIYKKYF